MESEVEVFADGKSLPLVPFVAKLIAATLTAMVRSLKGAEEAKEIRISIKVE